MAVISTRNLFLFAAVICICNTGKPTWSATIFTVPGAGHLFRYVINQPPKASSAFHPSGVSKWVLASAGKAKAGMVHSVSGCTRGVQVKLWDPLRTRAIPERLRGVITTRRYNTNPRLPLPLPLLFVSERYTLTLCPYSSVVAVINLHDVITFSSVSLCVERKLFCLSVSSSRKEIDL